MYPTHTKPIDFASLVTKPIDLASLVMEEAAEIIEFTVTETKRWKGEDRASYQVTFEKITFDKSNWHSIEDAYRRLEARFGKHIIISDGARLEATQENLEAVEHALAQLDRTDMPSLELSISSTTAPAKVTIEGPAVLVDHVREFCGENPSVGLVSAEYNPRLIIEWHSLGSAEEMGPAYTWNTVDECIDHYLSSRYPQAGSEEIFVAIAEMGDPTLLKRNYTYIARAELEILEPFDFRKYRDELILFVTLAMAFGFFGWGLLGFRNPPAT